MKPTLSQRNILVGIWFLVAALSFTAGGLFHRPLRLPSGVALPIILGIIAGILACTGTLSLVSRWILARKRKPPAEAEMVSRIYRLAAGCAIIMVVAYGFGRLASFGTFFTLFGGMLLGWSLQAPVSGFAAWVLVSLKRPFRPGDRVQFPSLGLTGDVKDIGVMYTLLNQVGGSIGSEEAVGRYILVPNAMLFSQVVINYTVTQEAAYMLDEVVMRITYDSNWESAERVLIDAAREVTEDIIALTGAQPYIRSDLYDYGVYMRLRYQTRVQDRAEIAYRITKRIFEGIQRTSSIDLAIPYVYSYRAGADKKDEDSYKNRETHHGVQELEMQAIEPGKEDGDRTVVERLAQSIKTQGLLQPIVVVRNPSEGSYDILAGHLRYEACRLLGWKTIPVLIVGGPSP